MYCQHVVISKAHMVMPKLMIVIILILLFVAIHKSKTKTAVIDMSGNNTIAPQSLRWRGKSDAPNKLSSKARSSRMLRSSLNKDLYSKYSERPTFLYFCFEHHNNNAASALFSSLAPLGFSALTSASTRPSVVRGRSCETFTCFKAERDSSVGNDRFDHSNTTIDESENSFTFIFLGEASTNETRTQAPGLKTILPRSKVSGTQFDVTSNEASGSCCSENLSDASGNGVTFLLGVASDLPGSFYLLQRCLGSEVDTMLLGVTAFMSHSKEKGNSQLFSGAATDLHRSARASSCQKKLQNIASEFIAGSLSALSTTEKSDLQVIRIRLALADAST